LAGGLTTSAQFLIFEEQFVRRNVGEFATTTLIVAKVFPPGT
jgi:hypothetical protein